MKCVKIVSIAFSIFSIFTVSANEITFFPNLFVSNVEIEKSVQKTLNMQGGKAWSLAELYPKGELGIFCGAKAYAEYEGVHASTQVRALNAAGEEIWSSQVYEIPTVCGRFDSTCRSSDEEEYSTNIPMNVVKELADIKVYIFER